MTHPAVGLEDIVHQRVRLGLLAVLNRAPKADFSELRSLLELTDGNLSRHLATLEDAGYVSLDKVFEARRPRTWVAITKAGRQAFAAEIASLRELIDAAEPKRSQA